MSDSRSAEPDDDEWAVSLDDLGDDEEESSGYQPAPIEPGNPTVEGVAFVVLGAALTLVGLFGGV